MARPPTAHTVDGRLTIPPRAKLAGPRNEVLTSSADRGSARLGV
ncbi:MAG: hypothetical protein ABW137_16450 [Mycobacterium sp.]